jgi:hypothetical protein
MLNIRIVLSLLLAMAFLPGTLVAQYDGRDSGEYLILGAQYGTEYRHVDVTNRLKELARQDRTFVMGNRWQSVSRMGPRRVGARLEWAMGNRRQR